MRFVDTVRREGLTDAFCGYPMGVTAENIVRQCGIGRAEQDAFALASHRKASEATRQQRFAAEIAPLTTASRKGSEVVSEDELIRHDASAEALAKLRPAFEEGGTVTAGKASGLIGMRVSSPEA